MGHGKLDRLGTSSTMDQRLLHTPRSLVRALEYKESVRMDNRFRSLLYEVVTGCS